MTDSEFFEKYPSTEYELKFVHRKESGFQDSIEVITYNLIKRKTEEHVATVKRTDKRTEKKKPLFFGNKKKSLYRLYRLHKRHRFVPS
jgi:hypothetical protein